MNGDLSMVWVLAQEREREIAKLQKYQRYKDAGQLQPAQLVNGGSKAAGALSAIQFLADSVRGMLSRPERASQATNSPS